MNITLAGVALLATLTVTGCASPAPTASPEHQTQYQREQERDASTGYVTLEPVSDSHPARSIIHGEVSPACVLATQEWNEMAEQLFISKSSENIQWAKLASWNQATSCKSHQ